MIRWAIECFYYIKNFAYPFIIIALILSFIANFDKPIFSDFPRKEIKDDMLDIKKISISNKEGNSKNIVMDKNLSNALDIQRISLLEKDNRLNSTLWLGGNFKSVENQVNSSTVAFGILVDSDKDPSTGKEGVDYQLELQGIKNNPTNGKRIWNLILLEYSSLGQYRIIDVIKNYSGFLGNNKNNDSLLLSLDMNKVFVYPSYRIMYYSLASYSNNTIEIDLSNWTNIPEDSFSIFTTPDEITIRQGESKIIGLQIISNSGKISTITDLYGLKNYTSLNIEILNTNNGSSKSNATIGGSYGKEPIQIKLTAPTDAKVGKHTIPISANISFGSNFPSNFIQFQNKYPIFIDTKGYELKEGNFTVNVIEPMSFQEELKNFWSVYGSIITLIGAGFAGGLSSLFFESLKEKRKRKEK